MICRTFVRYCTFSGLIFGLTTGCVSTHYGHEYRFLDEQLTVSCAKDHGIDHDLVKGISCAFENTGDTWRTVKVHSFTPLAAKGAEPAEVLSPDKVEHFLAAYRFEAEKYKHNMDMIMLGLVVAGVVVGSSGHDAPGMAMMAAGAAGGGITAAKDAHLVGHGINYTYGNTHLLGPDFVVPPKSFVRKIVLIEPPSNGRKSVWSEAIDLCMDEARLIKDGEPSCQQMKFWNPRDGHRF